MSDELPLLSADKIRDASKPKVKCVPIPSLGCSVYVRLVSAGDGLELFRPRPPAKTNGKKKTNGREQLEQAVDDWLSRYISACVLDANFEKVYTVEQARNLDADVYNELSLEVLEYNNAKLDLKTIREKLKKNQNKSEI